MNDSSQPETPNPGLAMWEDYVANCQRLAEQLARGAPGTGSGVFPFSTAWQQFADGLGIRSEPWLTHVAPAFGATREYQQIAQRMVDLAQRFQDAYGRLMQLGTEVSQRALHAVQDPKSAAADSRGGNPSDLYDKWIDGAEEAYAQIAHGDAFARLVGELCNILSGFKIERGKLLEALARHLDLPSRAEVDSLHHQLHELSVALRRLKAPETPPPPARRRPRKTAGP